MEFKGRTWKIQPFKSSFSMYMLYQIIKASCLRDKSTIPNFLRKLEEIQ